MDFNAFRKLVLSNRSCRRFDNSRKLDTAELENLVDLARNTASAANMQPLKYITVTDGAVCKKVCSLLGWAAYLKVWKGPEKKEQPTGFIVILGDTRVAKKFWCDHGITAQTMLLGARSMGLGGCIFASINTKKLKPLLEIDDHFEVKLVLAIGKPVESAVIDEIEPDGDIKYFRDDNQVHHVPKRKLTDVIVKRW